MVRLNIFIFSKRFSNWDTVYYISPIHYKLSSRAKVLATVINKYYMYHTYFSWNLFISTLCINPTFTSLDIVKTHLKIYWIWWNIFVAIIIFFCLLWVIRVVRNTLKVIKTFLLGLTRFVGEICEGDVGFARSWINNKCEQLCWCPCLYIFLLFKNHS